MNVLSLRCSQPADLETILKFSGVQAIDSTLLFGLEHLEFAIQKAKTAFERGDCISSNILIEAVIRASGQRQIKKALEMYGLNGSKEIVLFGEAIPQDLLELLEGESFDIKMDEKRISNLKKAFNIEDKEIEVFKHLPEEDALKELILERVALVSLL